MKNIFLKQIMMITVGILTIFSCDYDDNEYDKLTNHAPDPSATYYVQFKNSQKDLVVEVIPATGETVNEISTTVVVALLGLPLDQDLAVNLAVDPSSTATPNMYVLGTNSIVIPAGKVSASTTFKSVSANMPVGETVKVVLNVNAGENNATSGTTLTYSMIRPAPCVPVPGDYIVKMSDSFGDGWQTTDGDAGDGILVSLEDASGTITEIEVGMCSYWADSAYECTAWPDGQGSGECGVTYCFKGPIDATVTLPVGTQKMNWYFPGDEFGEISFEVYAPDGTLLFRSGGPGDLDAGDFDVVNCL